MNKLIALAVALTIATPAFAEDAKKPANPAAANTPVVTTPAAKPGDATKPQPAATTNAQKPGDVKKDEVKKDEKKSDVKTDGKVATPATGQATPATGPKTSEKPSDVKKQ